MKVLPRPAASAVAILFILSGLSSLVYLTVSAYVAFSLAYVPQAHRANTCEPGPDLFQGRLPEPY